MVHRLFLVLAPALLFAQLQTPDWVSVESNISYSKHPETVLDVYQSKRAPAPQTKRAGVLVIHGGGWGGGTKENVFERLCLPYLQKGLVVVNVEYRLSRAALAPAAVEDALLAADWFRANAAKYGVDKNKIIVTGDSAGGHLALMVGMTPKQAKLGPPAKVAAVINFYGITDVQDQLEGQHMRQYAVTWLPATLPDRQELARRVSPITWVRKDLPPILTIHGDQDPTVPYAHGVDLTKALREAGADAELIPVAQGAHGNFGPEKDAEIYGLIFNFLEKRKLL
ncbi:alpha/beta hydrolase [Bryobacter aggregatus]|uniref:alpha/beta hydrolase n=1 Tax=Bryobacter aggregatus TaxID=360054 RepID=UPI0004E13A1E|nr:alpha/beta hydrolase [Bryobacter aggregatus]